MTDLEGVVPALGQALDKRGYATLTPVQEAVLAPELKNADVLVSAQTGSGKTVAFGLAVAPTLLGNADQFSKPSSPLGLVVAPTRELAMQVKRELQWLYELAGASIASCVGGMDMRNERQALERGAHIVVGTPGRLRDHIERGSFDTSQIRAVVLDEADEMLDLGFREELEFILDATPRERRTMMFSATVPRTIATLAKRYQRDAVRVTTSAEQSQHLDIDYRALSIAPNDQENAIVNVLRYFDAKNALVFCSTRATVNRMTSRFINRGFSVVALSGELSQNERTHALQAMRDGRARVCIATDVAARGIDLPNLELVIHADLPKNKEALLHRSGRTGRAGRKGTCALIVPNNARKRTERLLSSANIEADWGKPPSADDIMQRDRERILTAPALSEPLSEFEQAFAQELLSRHSAEHIAAAYVRQHLAEQSAPEELRDVSTYDPKDRKSREGRGERKEKHRDDFKGGIWFSLSIGRAQSAEPRWILPMLCRWGSINKADIGAIKVQQGETHVELAPGCVDAFMEAIGPSRTIEKTVIVTRLSGKPKFSSEKSQDKKPWVGKSGAGKSGAERSREKPYKASGKKTSGKSFDDQAEDSYDASPEGPTAGEMPKKLKKKDKAKIKEKKKEKKKAKKDKKGNKSKLAAKVSAKVKKSSRSDRAAPEPGSSPLMRKKPRAD